MSNKFSDPEKTLSGETRASVPFTRWETLWFNTGTLCNLECENCYIESSPKNDRLIYIDQDDVTTYLSEIKNENLSVNRIGLTGGEPFLNPNIIKIIEAILEQGLECLILTNAFRVLKRWSADLLRLKEMYQDQIQLRVSLDHYTQNFHEKERGSGTFRPTLESIQWLTSQGFNTSIAGRSLKDENNQDAVQGYQNIFSEFNIELPISGQTLVVFPEMDPDKDAPEITTKCWGILKKSPSDIMCSSERMIVKRKGQEKCDIQACTLLAYDQRFNLGHSLKESMQPIPLNHLFCAQFCVLGGASCSST